MRRGIRGKKRRSESGRCKKKGIIRERRDGRRESACKDSSEVS